MNHSTPATSTSSPDLTELGAAHDRVAAAQSLAERRRIIEDIRAFNPKAQPSFLADFTTVALEDYLEHLRHARRKSVRLRGWLQLRSAALAEAGKKLQERRAA